MTAAVQKITVNVPTKLLKDALRLTGKGITPTIVDALLELSARQKRSALRALRGKVSFELDLETSRK